MSTDVTKTICNVIADVLETEPSEVSPEHHFVNDLGANSLDVVEFVMRLEDHFDVEVPDDAADSIQTVGDLVSYIEKLLSGDEHSHSMTTVAVGSDHAGLTLKNELLAHLQEAGLDVTDLGTNSEASTDYPDFAAKVATAVAVGETRFGVLVCGTGIGMCITANKVPGVRAALVHTTYEAEMARKHNDANVICFGARVIGSGQAEASLDTFLNTDFDPGDDGRHKRRVDLIEAVEESFKQ